MNYRGRRPHRGMTAEQVLLAAIVALVCTIAISTTAGAAITHSDPVQDFIFAITQEVEPT